MSAHDNEIITIISLCGRKDRFLGGGEDDPRRGHLSFPSIPMTFFLSFFFLFGPRYNDIHNISRVVGYRTGLGDVAWGFYHVPRTKGPGVVRMLEHEMSLTHPIAQAYLWGSQNHRLKLIAHPGNSISMLRDRGGRGPPPQYISPGLIDCVACNPCISR